MTKRDRELKEPDNTERGICDSCLYWDERTHWCDEFKSYGNADTTWSCKRWVDKYVYGG